MAEFSGPKREENKEDPALHLAQQFGQMRPHRHFGAMKDTTALQSELDDQSPQPEMSQDMKPDENLAQTPEPQPSRMQKMTNTLDDVGNRAMDGLADLGSSNPTPSAVDMKGPGMDDAMKDGPKPSGNAVKPEEGMQAVLPSHPRPQTRQSRYGIHL